MPGSHLLPLNKGYLLPHFRMLFHSYNHAGRIGLAARALQVPGNRAVGVLSDLRGGYDIAVVGTLIHHVLVVLKPINLSRRVPCPDANSTVLQVVYEPIPLHRNSQESLDLEIHIYCFCPSSIKVHDAEVFTRN